MEAKSVIVSLVMLSHVFAQVQGDYSAYAYCEMGCVSSKCVDDAYYGNESVQTINNCHAVCSEKCSEYSTKDPHAASKAGGS